MGDTPVRRWSATLASRYLVTGVVVCATLAVTGCGATTTVYSAATATTAAGATTTTQSAATATSASGNPHATATPGRPAGAATATPVPTATVYKLKTTMEAAEAGVAPGNNSPVLEATCPGGYVLAGGGLNASSHSFHILEDYPVNAETWAAQIASYASSDMSVILEIQCVQITNQAIQTQIVQQDVGSIAANTTVGTQTACPFGDVVAGGGLKATNVVTLVTSGPFGSDGWVVSANNPSGATETYTEYALCLKSTGTVALGASLQVGGGQSVATGTSSSATTTTCPNGGVAASGGYAVTVSGFPSMAPLLNIPTGANTWQSQLYNSSPAAVTYTVRVECLTISI